MCANPVRSGRPLSSSFMAGHERLVLGARSRTNAAIPLSGSRSAPPRRELSAGTIRDGPSRSCGGRTHPLQGRRRPAHLVGFSLGAQVGCSFWRPSRNSSIGRCCAGPSSTRCRLYGRRSSCWGRSPQRYIAGDQPLPECPPAQIPRPISMTTARMCVSFERTDRRRRRGVRGVHASRGTRQIGFGHIVSNRLPGDAGHPPLGGSASGTDAQRSRWDRSRYGARVGPCAIQTCSRAPSTAGSPIMPCLPRSHCRTRVVADSQPEAGAP